MHLFHISPFFIITTNNVPDVRHIDWQNVNWLQECLSFSEALRVGEPGMQF